VSAHNSRDPLAEEFLRYLEVERNVSPRTLVAYRQALEDFRAQKNARAWRDCRADDFRDYLFELMKKSQARSYIRLQFSAFRTFYRFLVERKNFRQDPVRELQLPKPEKKLPLVLTRHQIDELLAAPLRIPKHRAAPAWMPLRDTAILELFYSSGLRLNELASLNVNDLDIYTESVRVLGKGELLGELALFMNAPRSATAIAAESVTLLLIPANRLEALVRTMATLASQIGQFMERKRAEEALRFQKSLLESQSEAAIDGILVVSREGVMMSFNRRFSQMWDIPDEILSSRTDDRALQFVLDKLSQPEEFLSRVRYLYDRPNEESRDEILLKDGRTFDRYSAPVKGEQGAIYGRGWYFRDVTGRKQTEENLRRAAEETRRAYEDLKEAQAQLIRSEKLASIGMLVSGVAHEINNPLNVMYGNLQLLAEVSDVLLPLSREGARSKKIRGIGSLPPAMTAMVRAAATRRSPATRTLLSASLRASARSSV
jgi:integrase